jgi:hypothetical protein
VRALLVLACLTSLAAAEEQHFPRTAICLQLSVGGGDALSEQNNAANTGFSARISATHPMAVLPSFTVGARLVDRLELGVGFFPMLHYIFVYDGSGLGFPLAASISATVDLVLFAQHRASWFARAAFLAGSAQTGSPGTCGAPGNCGQQTLVGYHVALGFRYAITRGFALGLEAGTIGDFIHPGNYYQQDTYAGYVALDAWFYFLLRPVEGTPRRPGDP